MKVFFGCFITSAAAERLRHHSKVGRDNVEMYLEDFAQGVMVRPPGACLDMVGSFQIPDNGHVSIAHLDNHLSNISDVRSVFQFIRASHDQQGTISRMLEPVGEYEPRLRLFDETSMMKIVITVGTDHEGAVPGDTAVSDVMNLSNEGKGVVIDRLRGALRSLGSMFVPAARMENALGVLECCNVVQFDKVLESLKDAFLGECVPGLSAPGKLVF
jgi:hypothetical protein